MDGKEVIRHPKEESRYKGSKLGALVPDGTDSLGTGQGRYAQTGAIKAKLTIQRERGKGLPASLSVLVEVAHLLNAYLGTQARIFRSDIDWLLPLPQPSNRAQWAYLDSANKVRRRVACVEILQGRICSYLIEFEQRTSDRKTAILLISNNGKALGDHEFTKMLFEISKRKGSLENGTSLNYFSVLKLKHTWTSAEQYLKSIYNRLLSVTTKPL